MSRRITQGDAQAVLNAFGTGGRVILRNGQTAEAAPADFFGTHGSIRPFRNSPWDRGHFCAEDWHVILIAMFEGGDASFTRQQAEAILNPVSNSFTLDDAPLQTTRTSISRFLDPQPFGFEEAYYFQEGRIMSPDDLSVGEHRLSITSTDNTSGRRIFRSSITFFIDAAGTGACLND
jgi:hypothetical protein